MKKCSPHILALSYLFVLGNSIITLPFFKLNFILYIVLSSILCLLFMSFIYLIVLFGNRFKAIYYCALIAFCFIAVRSTINAFYDYWLFLKNEQLPQSGNILLGLALIGAVIPFALSKKSAFYKYCLLCAVISFFIIVLVTVSMIKHLDFSVPLLNFKFNAFSVKSFFNHFSHILLLPLIVSQDKSKHAVKSAFWGTALGFFLLLICSITCVLTLGQNIELDFAYIKVIGVISSGSLFTRIDGLFYFLFFVTSITKITVCIKTLLYVIKMFFKKANTL